MTENITECMEAFLVMHNEYPGVNTRFLRPEERLVLSEEKEMPLVLEAKDSKDSGFLQRLLASHSAQILEDISKYGAVLLRGFDIASDEAFEKTVLSIQGFRGISEAFMSEQGRIHVGDLKYVLHTNAVYKTGGTLYLGGFHSENYYSSDVPGYICFCCLKPSTRGGETGLVNMEKVYRGLDQALKAKLEKNTFFVSKWLVSEVAKRYHISAAAIESICQYFDLPVVGQGEEKFVLLYKPAVFVDPRTQKRALQINLFELPTLNAEMRQHFMNDYSGKPWFWHRFVWRLSPGVLKVLENIYVSFASLFYSPRESAQILLNKLKVFLAAKKKSKMPEFNQVKVGSCFDDKDIKNLAALIRKNYCSCLWQPGDILLVDNKQVVHAGMPGAGPRLVRALIGNPLEMRYSFSEPGYLTCKNRATESVGYYMSAGKVPEKPEVNCTV